MQPFKARRWWLMLAVACLSLCAYAEETEEDDDSLALFHLAISELAQGYYWYTPYDSLDAEDREEYDAALSFAKGCYESERIMNELLDERAKLRPAQGLYTDEDEEEEEDEALQELDAALDVCEVLLLGQGQEMAPKVESAMVSLLGYIEENDLKDTPYYLRALHLMGGAKMSVGDLQGAQRYLHDEKLWREVSEDTGYLYAICLHECSRLDEELGRKMSTLLYADLALDAVSRLDSVPELGMFLVRAAQAHAKMGNAVACRRLLKMAMDTGNTSETFLTQVAQAMVDVKLWEEALPLIEELSKSERTDLSIICSVAALGIEAKLHRYGVPRATQESRRFRDYATQLLAYLPDEQRTMLWRLFANVIPLTNAVLYASGSGNDAIYDNLLYSKGLLLRSNNLLRLAIEQADDREVSAKYAQMLQLRSQLIATTDRSARFALSDSINAIDRVLVQRLTGYAEAMKANDVPWQAVRDALAEGEAAVEFCNIGTFVDGQEELGESYVALVLRPGYDAPHLIDICGEALPEDDDIASLWQPLSQELQGVRRLFFAPDGELHCLPLESAIDIEAHRMTSTRELALRREPRPIGKAVLYGGLLYYPTDDTPDSVRYGMRYLPNTLTEVEGIATLLAEAGLGASTLTGNAGTEQSLRHLSPDVGLLHLATHGFCWGDKEAAKRSYVSFLANTQAADNRADRAMQRSGLLLSGANKGLMGEPVGNNADDGIITAQELSALNLSGIDLVVLSACQTGLGETTGDGVFGLQRGFKLAGARSLLMSLWKVDDRATRLLMTEFYGQLMAGATTTLALRAAQQKVRTTAGYEDPHYWAAFILLDATD